MFEIVRVGSFKVKKMKGERMNSLSVTFKVSQSDSEASWYQCEAFCWRDGRHLTRAATLMLATVFN